MDCSDSNRTNSSNQFVSHLNSQFDNVRSSFNDMYLKEKIAKETLQEMQFFKIMMIENVHDIRRVTSKLNSDNATLREQLIKMDTEFNLRLAHIERYFKETTIRLQQQFKEILKEKF